MIRRSLNIAVVLAFFGVSGAAGAGPVEAVFTSIPGHASSLAPGAEGVRFAVGSGAAGAEVAAGSGGAFGRPVASPSGRWWAVTASAAARDGSPAVLMLVGGEEGAYVALRTGAPAPSGQVGGSPGVLTAILPAERISDDGTFSLVGYVRHEDGVELRRFTARVVKGKGVEVTPSDTVPADPDSETLAALPEPSSEPGEDALEFDLESLVVTAAGEWLVRGTDASGNQWVFRNGEPVAQAGTPVTQHPQEEERFLDTVERPAFFAMHANRAGDMVVGGMVEREDGDAAAAVVLNNQRVILREGQEVELGGVGREGGAYIHAFTTDGAFLADNGWYYFTAELRGSGGEDLGEALLRTRICRPDWDASGAANSTDLARFVSEWIISVTEGCALGDYNRDGRADSADVAAFLADWLRAAAGGC